MSSVIPRRLKVKLLILHTVLVKVILAFEQDVCLVTSLDVFMAHLISGDLDADSNLVGETRYFFLAWEKIGFHLYGFSI